MACSLTHSVQIIIPRRPAKVFGNCEDAFFIVLLLILLCILFDQSQTINSVQKFALWRLKQVLFKLAQLPFRRLYIKLIDDAKSICQI